MADTPIRWNDINFLGVMNERWNLSSAVLTPDGISISPGGKAELIVTDEVNNEFKYCRMIVTYHSTSVSAENNYRSKPTILVQEVYKDSNNTIDKVKIRSIGFNTNKKIAENQYTDETIFSTLDRPMATLKLIIHNETDTALDIYGIAMYQSIDISESQITKMVNQIYKEGAADQIKVYRNSDNSVNGLGVFMQGASYELKLRPAYFNGQLIAIDTNFGQTISIQNIQEAIDLLT